MSIILKHIFRNIKEHKIRSILIFLALLISTCVLIIDIVLPEELYVKIEDTFKTIYGNTDIQITTVEEFNLDDLKLNDIEFDYVGINGFNSLSEDGKPSRVIGIDINKAKELKLLGSDVPELKDNEVIVNEYNANDKGYKKGDIIKLNNGDKEYEFIIKDVVQKKGLAALESESDIFITSLELLNNLDIGIEEGKYTSIFIDVKNEEDINKLSDYIKNNNDNYIVSKTIDSDELKEEMSFVKYLMTLIFFMSTIMIFFVISSLNKIMLAERIPVIGTFRSVGANRSKMNTILLIENALYGVFAGLIGSICGIYLDSIVSKKFVVTSGVELSNKSISISPKLIIIGILFATGLQMLITFKEIVRTNKKPVKTLIFNTQNSRYKIRKVRTILGFIFVILSIIIHILNTKINILFTMASIILLIVGIASIVPLIMQLSSKILAFIFKKINHSTGIIASKNIGYNKMIISSSRLIVVSLSLLSTIVLVSNSFTKIFTSFREVTKDYDIVIQNISDTSEKYDELIKIDGVREVQYLYYYFDNDITYNDGKKFNIPPVLYTSNNDTKYVDSYNHPVKELKENEILVDEKVAFKSNIKVGDILKIKYGDLNKIFEYKVVGLCDSTYFSTSRNVLAINYEHFINDLTDVPEQVHIVVEDDVDLNDMKETLKKEIKEINLRIKTVDEYIEEQENETTSIMSIFYVILGLSVFLSFIGIVNNQIISFMQRRRELAVLNSTCMSKNQIKRMLLSETIISNLIASILVFVVSFLSVMFINYFMQGIDMYVTVKYDFNSIFNFVGIINIILLFTLIIPIKKLNKMNIVNEIKYE